MLNKSILVGRLTSDPELRQTQSGISVTSFAVACNRSYSKDKEQQADFINCVAWRNTAEFISKYFRKGNAIGIDGSIQTRKYIDKDGNNRIAVEVVVGNACFVEGKSSGGSNNNAPQASAEPRNDVQYQTGSFDDFQDLESDDDLPF